MSWCRANIGLGELNNSIPTATNVPYSLRAPLLSRVPQDNFPGLPYSLGTALSSYLLSVLDSPAYSNLTPHFLANEFNPNTPDRPDVKYFSVGARIERLGVWHPLWLPKVILDAAESRRTPPLSPEDRGNDGLVGIESARWGEYLGTVEGCDHWELRGAASFARRPSSAPVSSSFSSPPPGSEEKSRETSWTWRDVNVLVRRSLLSRSSSTPSSSSSDGPSKPSSPPAAGGGSSSRSLHDLASWILSRIPLPLSSRASSNSSVSSSGLSPRIVRPSIDPSWPVDDALVARDKDESNTLHNSHRYSHPHPQHAALKSNLSPSSSSSFVAFGATPASSPPGLRLLYGSAPPDIGRGKDGKFDLEALYIGLCRKLYEEGL
jgi:hypothetical protein